MTSTASYTLVVAPPVQITTPTLPPAENGQPYQQAVQTTGGVAPFTFAVTSGSLPPGFKLDGNTGIITGMPNPSSAGTYTFTVTVTDAHGQVSSQTYTIVILAAITIAPGSLPHAMVGVPYSQTLTVSGGTPPYTLSITSGALPAGLTFDAPKGTISGRAATSGSFTFTIQARDASNTTGSMQYTLVVDARPDPSVNPDVRGLVSAQTNAMSQFSTAQTENILRHLEDMHWGARCASRGSIDMTGSAWDGRFHEPNPGPTASPAPSASLPLTGCIKGKISTWAGGSFDFGSSEAQNGSPSMDFHTDGITGGIDARLSKQLLAGFALGGGFNGTTFGTSGSSLRASNFSEALYASYHPSGNLFLDGLLGASNAAFDDSRWNAPDKTFVPGHRTANGTFASLVAGFQYRNGRLEYVPYLRADEQWSNFGSMIERSDSVWGLNFAPMSVNDSQLVAGLRSSYDIQTGAGLLVPMARLEFHAMSNGAQAQSLMYQDGLGPTYLLSVPTIGQQALSGSFGLRMSPGSHTVFQIEYDFFTTKGTFQHTLRPYINITF